MAIEEGRIDSNIIIIDTSAYAGNFERELCAYLTGQIAECSVGQAFLKSKNTIKHLEWWDEHISPQEDSEGSEFYRPCTIWNTNNTRNYNSVAIFVDEFPPQEVIDEMLERAKEFCDDTEGIYKAHKAHKNSNIPKTINILSYSFIESKYARKVTETSSVKTVFKQKL